MTLFISHRVNTVDELKNIDKSFGVEIDIRSENADLILQHDPFKTGEKLDDWLLYFDHKFLILNVKEDGLEQEILNLLTKFKVVDFFFLDQAFPSLRKTIVGGVSSTAVRVSEFEDFRTALNSNSDWVWLDSHTGDWSYLKESLLLFRERQIKTCIVSPELQGRFSLTEANLIRGMIERNEIDAICTKFPNSWVNLQLDHFV